MVSFGFSTLIDFLSWTAALALALKIVATLILLRVDKAVWDRPGWGAGLWWATKITPVIAVPCIIWLALLQGLTNLVWIYSAMMLFVVVAVHHLACAPARPDESGLDIFGDDALRRRRCVDEDPATPKPYRPAGGGETASLA